MNIKNQNEAINDHNCYIFYWTGFWIVIPMMCSLVIDSTLHFLLFVTLFSSSYHWSYYRHNSIAHYMDRVGSFCTLSWVSLNATEWKVGVYMSIAVFCFLKGYYWFKKNKYKAMYHLIFRFFSFLAIMTHLKKTNDLLIFSSVYWIQVVYLTIYPPKSKKRVKFV